MPRLSRRARRRLAPPCSSEASSPGAYGRPPPSAAAPDDIPPQQPGVTLQVFDTQIPLSKLCTLKPGQTSNHDTLMPTVDWSTTGDFGGFADNFSAEVSGYLVIPDDGSFTFRLTSNDGSRLTIDDRTVIDHDGLHAGEPKDGSVQLAAGSHPFPIDYFERAASSTWRWRGGRRPRTASPRCRARH